MTMFDRLTRMFSSDNTTRMAGDSPRVVGQKSSESTSSDELTSEPIQLRRLSRIELEVACMEYAGGKRLGHASKMDDAIQAVGKFRVKENRRRARAGRQNKKSAADPLQSSNVMESQK